MHNRGADRRRAFLNTSRVALGLQVERRQSDDRRRNGYISQLQLFSTIPYDAVEKVLANCIPHDVQAGAVLLEPGQRNDSIHLLVSGRLRIHLDSVDSADYIPIDAGGCFGELSIIDGRPVSAYVVADVHSRVLTIHESLFWDKLIPHPGVARNLLMVLSDRMRQNRDMIVDRIKDRLALEHLQKELSIASNIQLSLLPHGSRLFPDRDDVQAYAIMEPAKEVGGDLYDAFFVTPERLFIAVGDVSGKGVPAALFMARTITQLRMEAVRRRSPSAVLEAVNRALCEGNDAGMFVTLFCAMFDTSTGQFSFANAGHNPPVFIGIDGRPVWLKVKKGLVAGILEGARYPSASCQLVPGDAVLLYTDGITEAMNADEALYSEAKLLDTCAQGGADEPADLIVRLRASIAGFVQAAPQADDITLLALRYRGATNPPADEPATH